MALQVDSQDQVQELLAVLGRRRWLILLPAAYLITLASVIAVFVPKRYVADMEINLLEARVDNDDYDRNSLQESATLREIGNAQHQAKQVLRVQRVIEELNWVDYLQLDKPGRDDYVSRVRDRIDVEVVEKRGDQGSTFVTMEYSDVDPERAIQFLERLSNLWVTEVYQRDVDNLRQEAETFRKLRDEAKKEYERLERERRQVITDNDLTPAQVDGTARGRDEDPVQVALNERRAELEDLEVTIGETSTEIQSMRELIDTTPKDIQVLSNDAQTYDKQIQALEAGMQGMLTQQDRFLPANTEWQRIQDQLAETELQIERLRDAARQVTITSTSQANPQRLLYMTQLDQLEVEMDKLVARRTDLARRNDDDARELETRINALGRIRELDAEIDASKLNYADSSDALFQREQQLRVLQEAYAQPWVVTDPAATGEKPTEPNTAILIVIAVVAGFGIGIGLAVVSELLQGGFRNAGDASRAINLPVLGVVGEFRSRAARRASALRQVVMVFSSALILGSLGWFTWTWANRPELLSTTVLEAIEDVRSDFR